MGWLWRGVRWGRRSVAWGLVAVLLVMNVLTLTWSMASALASAAIGAIGLTTVAARQATVITEQGRAMASRRAATRAIANRIAGRTARGAARTIAAVPLKAIPFAGGVAVVSFTSWEVYDACQTMEDLSALDETPLDIDTATVCGLPYPSWDDLWRAPTIDVPAELPPAP